MTSSDDGREVTKIFWSNGESLHNLHPEKENIKLIARHIGNDEWWIEQYRGDKLIASHNCRFIETIIWED